MNFFEMHSQSIFRRLKRVHETEEVVGSADMKCRHRLGSVRLHNQFLSGQVLMKINGFSSDR